MICRLLFAAAWIAAAVVLSSSGHAADVRPVVSAWQQLTLNQDGTGVSLSSNIGTGAIALKFSNAQTQVLRNDPTLISVADRRVSVDHLRLDEAFRNKPADAVLAAYHDFINADLQRRGWKEVVSERAKFATRAKVPALYWMMQAESGRRKQQDNAHAQSVRRRHPHKRGGAERSRRRRPGRPGA